MNKPIDPEEVRELIFYYRSIASNLRARRGDPRNGGMDEYEFGKSASIYDSVADELERLLK